jgi:PAS domain-containing protein
MPVQDDARTGVTSALRILELDAARWRAVLDTARDAIISIDRHGLITLFNRSAENLRLSRRRRCSAATSRS